MKTEASGQVESPQPINNSLFSGREHKINASSIRFVSFDWCPYTQTITWDTGFYKAVYGKIIDIAADHHACPTPAQISGFERVINPEENTAGRWWPCKIGYTEYAMKNTRFWEERASRPVIIIPVDKVDEKGGAV